MTSLLRTQGSRLGPPIREPKNERTCGRSARQGRPRRLLIEIGSASIWPSATGDRIYPKSPRPECDGGQIGDSGAR